MAFSTEAQGKLSFLDPRFAGACWTKAEGGDMSLETQKVATGCYKEPKVVVPGAVDVSELTIEKNLDLPIDNGMIGLAHLAMKSGILNSFEIVERKLNQQGLMTRFQLYRGCVIKNVVVAMYDAESSNVSKLTFTLDVTDVVP